MLTVYDRQILVLHEEGFQLPVESLPRVRQGFAYRTSVWRNDINCTYILIFPMKKIAHKGLKMLQYNVSNYDIF